MGWPYQQKPPMGWPIDFANPLSNFVSYWPMLIGDGDEIFDLSGNGRAGTLTDVIWQPGKFGSCLYFDGDGCKVQTPTVYHNIGAGDFTVLAWVKPYAASGCIWSNANYSPAFYVAYGGFFGIYWGGTVLSGANLTLNIWQQVVLVRENGFIKFYINGIQTPTTTEVTTSMTNAYWLFGSSTDGPAEELNGQLDIPSIYNRALSSSEIAQLCREPFCMFKDPAEIPLLDQYYTVTEGGIMTPNTRYWGAL